MLLLHLPRKVVLTRLCGVVPEIADLGVELRVDVGLNERIHDTHEQNTDHNGNDDPDGLVNIKLGFGIGNGSLRLAVNLVALVVDGFLMLVRNDYMVDHSDLVLAIWNGEQSGGTWHTIQYAKAKGKQVDIIKVDRK